MSIKAKPSSDPAYTCEENTEGAAVTRRIAVALWMRFAAILFEVRLRVPNDPAMPPVAVTMLPA